jgi:soluble lytic murein transglycosylase-like protein
MKRFVFALCASSLVSTCVHAFCFDEAGREQNINPRLLKAIAEVESNMRADVVNRGHIDRTGTVDIGLMQINSGAMPRLLKQGITQKALLEDPCLNVRVGAQILAEKFKKEGEGWEGVGAYNASCKELKGQDCVNARSTYVMKVWRALNRQSPAETSKEFAAHVPVQRANTKSDAPRIGQSRIESVEIAITSAQTNSNE